MKIGYLKSSLGSTIEMLKEPIRKLKENQCEKIVIEILEEEKKQNPKLENLLKTLSCGDQLVLIGMNHFAFSFKELFTKIALLEQKEIHLQFINEQIDTTLERHKDFFLTCKAITDFRKDIARKNTLIGLKAARARGRKGGRPKGLSQDAEKKAVIAKQLYQKNKLSINDITQHLAISKSTLYRYLRLQGVEINGVSAI